MQPLLDLRVGDRAGCFDSSRSLKNLEELLRGRALERVLVEPLPQELDRTPRGRTLLREMSETASPPRMARARTHLRIATLEIGCSVLSRGLFRDRAIVCERPATPMAASICANGRPYTASTMRRSR